MAEVAPLLWSEGMLLTPHCFQQADRAHQEAHRRLGAALAAHAWGLTRVEVAEEALANGVFRLERCAGLLPGGLCFDLPGEAPLPAGRGVGDFFAPTAPTLTVYLALPRAEAGRPGAALLIAPGAPAAPVRWAEERLEVVDVNTGRDSRPVPVARAQWVILFEGEERDGFDAIPVARLGRSVTGGLTLDPTYAPPALHLAACAPVQAYLRVLFEQLAAKAQALGEQRRHRSRDLVDFGTADTATYWLLHTVNTTLPEVADLVRTPTHHPHTAYLVVARLAGALATFSTEINAADVGPYVHDDLGATFAALRLLLGRLLGTVTPTRWVNVPLSLVRAHMYQGRAADAALFTDAELFLAVRAEMAETDLIGEVQHKGKVASPDQIDSLIASALPGIRLVHAPRPPAALPMRTGTVYFRLEPGAAAWTGVRASGAIALYLPIPAPDLTCELLALKE
ncbi:MAG: type VI secretion system baseplate subunit TssK [Nitrospirae bacterium CG_4_10_14_3_um_filter_70_108]|nr:MAG: type VI secretion system baseplate subunit TssK [Nitrospirae bacterium CG_4_10_14_3_um_filter_70_108]